MVELWVKKEKKVKKLETDYTPFFYLYLPDPHAYAEMLEDLENRFKVEECTFPTIYGELEGYRIYCRAEEIRKLAELIELQTKYAAKLYNVDIRLEQRYFAENGMFPAGYIEEDCKNRFDPDFSYPHLEVADVFVKGEKNYPALKNRIVKIRVNETVIKGAEREILEEFSRQIELLDPDVILFPHADYWMELIVKKSRKYGVELSISRNGRFRKLASKSYWSYGRVAYRPSAYIPMGRILIDTASSFTYREGGVEGILLASRLAGISPNYAARFTPGTLISSYEVYEALRKGIAVPFRKSDAEDVKKFNELKRVDRGGMIFQPKPGIYENVFQLDFTSMYPSIIVKYNLSPESLNNSRRGFLVEVLEPLLALRLETKRKKKANTKYAKLDSILKWMLVTCFGYTGYRNAKFGRIEVHEAITSIGREILLKAKEIAENMGFEVLHGIVDSLWLRGDNDISELRRRVESHCGLHTDIEHYNWIVFLPMSDGFGAYNRYYGRLKGGEMKLRGVASRRCDTPEYIRKMQMEMFSELSNAEDLEEVRGMKDKLLRIYHSYRDKLKEGIDAQQLVIWKRIGRLKYSKRCAEDSAVKAYRKFGVHVVPGMEIGFVVKDAKRWVVDPPWNTSEYDVNYYLKLLDKAWNEIAFVFRTSG